MRLLRLVGILASLVYPGASIAGPPEHGLPSVPLPANRIVSSIDEGERVPLSGNVHPLVSSGADIGSLPASQTLSQMVLVLKTDSQHQLALTALLTALQDSSSPAYHHWLTPNQFGEIFGVSSDDIATVTDWLIRHGLQVDFIPESRRAVIFTGAAAQVESAFHTMLRRYNVAGEMHFANAIDPEIPAALAPVVEGIVSLHDFRAQPMHHETQPTPEHTAGSYHYLAPGDFATIYNAAPLYSQAIDGTGQSIAIVARSNVDLNDIRSFRSKFNFPPKDPALIFPSGDPGKDGSSDQAEATLDVEWAGATARNATILLVPAASSGSTDGALLSAQYIVNKALAPILSMSFAACESALGAAGNSFVHSLWQQAAAEGITVLVSSGDSGAAGCDASTSSRATSGVAVNGFCSTPDATCVGGTEFDDTALPSLYWSNPDQSAHRSAFGYIPEIAWNESGGTSLTEPSGFSLGTGLASTGGGSSRLYPKPLWQIGTGVPADGRRDVPDIAFAAAGHDGYLVQWNGKTQVFSGTSVAVASFAGVLALIEQSAGASEGNINPRLYNLARRQFPSPVFHDVTGGNNSVPGLNGYTATNGYDLPTGLGSLDAQAMLSTWDTSASAAPQLTLAITAPSVRLFTGSTAVVRVGVTVNDGSSLSTTVRLTIAALPPGVTARYSPVGIGVPGMSTLTLAATRGTQPGTYAIQVTATPSDGSQPVTLSVTLRILIPRRLRPIQSRSERPSTASDPRKLSAPAHLAIARPLPATLLRWR